MKNIFLLLLGLMLTATAKTQSLAEKLGYLKTDRLLIVNCDDVGMCHAANLAVLEGQAKGIITSGSVMVPCPQFMEAVKMAKENPKLDLGIHLTLTAEWKNYSWGIIGNPEKEKGLIDSKKYMWKSVGEVYHNSTPLEVYYEAKAQIKKALDAGLKVTHIDSHMEVLQLSPPYVDVYLQLAAEYNLPVRMFSQETLESFGLPDIRKRFAGQGILSPDYFIYEELESYSEDSIKNFWTGIVQKLKPGITELYINASVPDNELKNITDSWKIRNTEYELFTKDQEFREFVKNEGIILIGYKPIFLIPFKSIAFETGVNYTAGLPIVRTSPDHGVGYDIAGQNKASEISFRSAVYLACDIFQTRKGEKELSANPLKYYSRERE